MMPVGAVAIVTYNCASQIRDCLASLEASRDEWEVAVADNGSADETLRVIREEFPWARLIEIGSNVSFSHGCNVAARATSAPWVFFLNPDTIVPAGALTALLSGTLERGATISAPRLDGVDGLYQANSANRRLPTFAFLFLETLLAHRVWPGNPWRRRADLPAFDPATTRTVEQPLGAALLVRRDVFESVEGFDERFRPIWFEDVDICRRLIDRGHEIAYVNAARITHIGKHTLSYFPATMVLARWNANLVRYARKHFSPLQAGLIFLGAIVGTVLRGTLRAPGHFRLAARMLLERDEARWYR